MEKPTYAQVINELYARMEQKGIAPEGLCRNGYDLDVARILSNLFSVAQGHEHENIDAKGEQLFEECQQAITVLEEHESKKSIEELL